MAGKALPENRARCVYDMGFLAFLSFLKDKDWKWKEKKKKVILFLLYSPHRAGFSVMSQVTCGYGHASVNVKQRSLGRDAMLIFMFVCF